MYAVNNHLNIGMCDCLSFQGGKYCKHICAVEPAIHILCYYNFSNLRQDYRNDLVTFATGENIVTRFFENMMQSFFSNNKISSPSQGNSSLHLEIDEFHPMFLP